MLEMLVVAMLGVLVVTFIANASRWYSRSLHEMNVSAQLDKELKMACQAIAQDFGTSLAAQTTNGANLQLDYDSGDGIAQWGTPDTVVEYVVQGGNLVRRDIAGGTVVPMAGNISELSAQIVDGNLNVHLIASFRDTQQDITLQLQDPG
jgi:hypothetical protein